MKTNKLFFLGLFSIISIATFGQSSTNAGFAVDLNYAGWASRMRLFDNSEGHGPNKTSTWLGTKNPDTRLDFGTVQEGRINMSITPAGNVGVGFGNINNLNTLISEKFMVAGKSVFTNFENASATWDNLKVWADGYSSFIQSNGDENGLRISSGTGNKIYVGDDNDKVFIGYFGSVKTALANDYDLYVHRGILTEDLAIGAKEHWPDYVFEKKYNLKPLEEVENFIKENKHLPNIPSQKEVSEKGYSTHDLNVRLLEKIEELTLYTIEQQKMIKMLKEEVDTLKKDVKDKEQSNTIKD